MNVFTTWCSGLQSNLNLCIFLQAFNAISEWEYVKKESMCIFFLISMICLLENVSFIDFKCNMGNVPYSLYKVCCLQILKQCFGCVICNASVAQWESFRQKKIHIFAFWKALGSNPGWDQHFLSFFGKKSAAFSSIFPKIKSYYFSLKRTPPEGNLSEEFWI